MTAVSSTILLHCHSCREKVGSLDIDDLSVVTAEQIIEYLIVNRIKVLCFRCNCEHQFSDSIDSYVKDNQGSRLKTAE